MNLKRIIIFSLLLASPIILGSCNSIATVYFHQNGVTNNMQAVGPISINESDKRIYRKGEQGVRTALIEAAREKYSARVDNVVDIEESKINGRRVFSGIAIVYK
ncbi:hypothetical protein PVA44_02030 [Entomospira nematocerorum]|uniref:DUF1471 domain-containing protein n=1 Tax=Entomospira nematocerorum TaxID=2719987 RepID=A0A968GCC3_9SPIO|nr:hypothetical protein [Entomospira nematocera]NIZ47189.1 hypothetical protein [Entomospira nematocera]WDI34268.1 hypothetical protein PVA44_02030 [Entomospira nematocera]